MSERKILAIIVFLITITFVISLIAKNLVYAYAPEPVGQIGSGVIHYK